MEKSNMTALEWLINEISTDRVGKAIIQTLYKEFQQAKQMEKQQHSVTYGNALKDMIHNKINFEQYYNETFKNTER